jgi:hypothetical protein
MKTYSIDAPKRLFSITVLMFFFGVVSLYSQVALAPSALFIQGRTGIGNIYVTNPSASPQEVNVDFIFGYPGVDSVGNLTMIYQDSVAAKTYALNPFVKAYPRSFILQPKAQQTLRLQVRTNNSLRDAFLFTRIKVSSVQKSPDVEKKPTQTVSAQVSFKFEQILPVFYRKGNVNTGLTIHHVSTSLKEKTLTVLVDAERTGTAPFIGSSRAVLYSAANTEVARFEETTSIYFQVKQRINVDVSKAGAGVYRLVLTYETKRSDVAVEDLIQAPPVTKEVTVNIQ